ncbi:MAG: SgcJ/EcaC family oxidoreductase [Phaeodactylibacter sp.]|uniref:SgcJ/EcaC family oxidoreductase n=1 Tax=Phaeodactylibacter sp. TaxID=1940289 RepID=UPI0032EFAC68
MNNFILLTALLLTAVSMQAQTIDTEIAALGSAWEAAYERGDAAALAAVHAEKVEIVNADGSLSTVTRADIEANWAKTFAGNTGTIEFADDMAATLLSDGKANTKGSFTQTMTNKETGETTTFKGHFDHHAVKVDGRWLLSRLKVSPQ